MASQCVLHALTLTGSPPSKWFTTLIVVWPLFSLDAIAKFFAANNDDDVDDSVMADNVDVDDDVDESISSGTALRANPFEMWW